MYFMVVLHTNWWLDVTKHKIAQYTTYMGFESFDWFLYKLQHKLQGESMSIQLENATRLACTVQLITK